MEVIVGRLYAAHSWNSSGVRSLLVAYHRDHRGKEASALLERGEGRRWRRGGGAGGGVDRVGGRGVVVGEQSDLDDNRLPDEL